MARQYRGVVRCAQRRADRRMGRTQLVEQSTGAGGRIAAIDRLSDQADDLLVTTELAEVFECEIDRAPDCARGTQVAELVELSLTA